VILESVVATDMESTDLRMAAIIEDVISRCPKRPATEVIEANLIQMTASLGWPRYLYLELVSSHLAGIQPYDAPRPFLRLVSSNPAGCGF
jgi:hypothetical protein